MFVREQLSGWEMQSLNLGQSGFVQSGTEYQDHKDPAWKLHQGGNLSSVINGFPALRTFRKVVHFEIEFDATPIVFISTNWIDAKPGGSPNTANVRINTQIVSVDRHDFTFEIMTWDQSLVWGLGISWLALGSRTQ